MALESKSDPVLGERLRYHEGRLLSKLQDDAEYAAMARAYFAQLPTNASP